MSKHVILNFFVQYFIQFQTRSQHTHLPSVVHFPGKIPQNVCSQVLEPCLAIASLALDMSEQELSEHWLAEAGILLEEVGCCGKQIRTKITTNRFFQGGTAGQLRLARYLPRGGADVPELL